ncbi:DUF904 domain-containing protein [Ideonella paludis]|uniref:DUF904 domain-containing protein n=1 Tax=Ideonella paludis TaxID=1233411 RepID=UPI00362D772C
MSRLSDLADRIERLVLRHEELARTNALLTQQVQSLSAERDSLKSRLGAARARIDALLERLPTQDASPQEKADEANGSHHPGPELFAGLP